MAQAVKDFRDRNLHAVRNQSHTIGRRKALACPDVYTNMVMVVLSGEEQRTRVRALGYTQAEEFTVKSLCGSQVPDMKVDVPEVDLPRRVCRRRFGGDGREDVVEIKGGRHHRNLAILPTPA